MKQRSHYYMSMEQVAYYLDGYTSVYSTRLQELENRINKLESKYTLEINNCKKTKKVNKK